MFAPTSRPHSKLVETLPFIAGLHVDGVTAPYVIDGALDGLAFLAYVEQVLFPSLDKGDIALMDNLRTPNVDGVTEALRAIGAKVRYLPAYLPDLDPIEMLFAKLKAARHVRSMRSGSSSGLVRTVASEERRNYSRHAGYSK